MLKDRVSQDLKSALKAGDRIAVDTYRMLLTGLKNEQVAKKRELSEEEEIAVVRRAVKSRQEAVALYERGGRPELAEKERREIEVARTYLPQQLTEQELANAVDGIIRDLGATSKKDMGRVMKELMSRHAGRVDGRVASQIVSSRLN